MPTDQSHLVAPRTRGVLEELDAVRIRLLRDDRFTRSGTTDSPERTPKVGDRAAIIVAHAHPTPAFEVECVGAEGAPEWTAVLYTEELALEFPAKPPERSRA